MSGGARMDDIGAVILAGGESRRFGRNKPDASWRGSTLLARVLEALPAECAHRLLVTRAVQPQPAAAAGCDQVVHDDPDAPPGPLRGLVRGLQACPTSWAWVVACDLPLLRPDLLRLLRRRAEPGDLAVVPRWQDRLQPLCALYAREAAQALAAAQAAGERTLRGAVATIGYRPLDESDLCRVDPRGLSFVNVNTPRELAALADIARGGHETEM
ncbi:molybdenum cofactor guanylyltransferase [bacterium]|nr:molybdenum cofactor guanylyltransferase [bacterium]